MLNCYFSEQSRKIDQLARQAESSAAPVLMERAGQALWQAFKEQWPNAQSVGVFCGAGNNGGDGYIFARLACEAGCIVHLYSPEAPSTLKGDALKAWKTAEKKGLAITSLEQALSSDVLLDALLGTGLSKPVNDPLAAIISDINNSARPVLAADIPSGLCANTGARLGICVLADVTVTMIVPKPGLYTGVGPDYTGQIYLASLEVEEAILSQVPASALGITFNSAKSWLHPRRPSTHKGACGHVVVLGGNLRFAGAGLMAGTAGLRSGCGKVSWGTHPQHAAWAGLNCPEIMTVPLDNTSAVTELCEQADVIAVGPGLGQDEWGLEVLKAALSMSLPTVLDADALNLIARYDLSVSGDFILTPHPGEAARLLNSEISKVQADRFEALAQLVERTQGVVVLKGCGSLIAGPNWPTHICLNGNPGMATAGMGDILTGTIAGLWAQGLSPEKAATLGVCVHGKAGELAALSGSRGMMATDILPFIRSLLGN